MSNGRHALNGFEYQITVNLDLILQHFKDSTEDVLIYPEDEDDLVIINNRNNIKSFYQIKKPKEYDNGKLKNEQWSLHSIAREILPGTFDRLAGNIHQQIWILGDTVSEEVKKLISAGVNAPDKIALHYLTVIHILARKKSGIRPEKKSDKKDKLVNWKPADGSTVSTMADEFFSLALSEGIKKETCEKYKEAINKIDSQLPDVLSRITIKETYGIDEEIRNRIQTLLEERYKLKWEIIKDTLIPGLRNYIYNISSQNGKIITKDDFEKEIRIVWPRMTMVCEPPELNKNRLRRLSLVQEIISKTKQGPVEVTGISGSGKTTFAGELIDYIKNQKTDTKLFYVEVHSDKSFKDVLAGIAFHLRKIGINELWPITINYSSSDEKVLFESAETFSSIKTKLMVIIDLVHGTCSDEFAIEISKFIEKFKSETVQLIVMGQVSSFKYLSNFQRNALKLSAPLDIPGFSFEEVISLYKIIHTEPPDRSELWYIYNKLTANRQSGLPAYIANSIISCKNLSEMKNLANSDAEDAVNEATRNRYNQIDEKLRTVTNKILCFFMPFSEEEAAGLFPSDRVKETIREAVAYGLLRPLDNSRFEFHETVRKGLIKDIPPSEYISINKILADYYLQEEEITPAIYHLEAANKIDEARDTARRAFIEGKNRGNLKSYITKHRLIESSEIVQLLKNEKQSEKNYMLPDMLKNIGNKADALELLKAARDESEHFDKDYQWAWRIIEAILVCDPEKLYELVVFGLEKINIETENDRLKFIIQGIRRPDVPIIDKRLLNLFSKKPDKIKKRLLPLLFLDKRREVLTPALKFVNSQNFIGTQEDRRHDILKNINLKIDTMEELREFLASLPVPNDLSRMLIQKSVLLGSMESYIWTNRHFIKTNCIEILKEKDEEEIILINTLRILIFYQDESVIHYTENNTRTEERLKTLIAFIPLFFPHLFKPEKYHRQASDRQLPIEERLMAFSMLSNMGENIDLLIDKLISEDEPEIKGWKFFIVTNSILYPNKKAIPVFEKMLNESDDQKTLDLLAPIILKFGELPGDDVTYFLIRMLKTKWSQTKLFACLSLQQHRSRKALPALIHQIKNEKDPTLRQMALVAAVASDPGRIDSFNDIWTSHPDNIIWRCILAERLQAVTEAEWLVKMAIDQTKPWQIRRAAILAAGALPFDTAMKRIYKSIMKKKSPFSQDKSSSLYMHNIITSLLLSEGRGFLQLFKRGKDNFIDFWGDIFQTLTQDTFYPITIEDGNACAEWLFNRLEFHRFPVNLKALDIIIDELHIPILQAAVLRGLRLTGESEIIEDFIAKADTEWLLLRILCELFKKSEYTADEITRITKLLLKSQFSTSNSAKNIMKNMSDSLERKRNKTHVSPNVKLNPTCLNYNDIKEAIETGKLPGEAPYKLVNLTEEQLTELVNELAPERDHETRLINTEPKLTFGESGPTLTGPRFESTTKNGHIREKLRAALCEGNKFGIDIPWHSNLLAGRQGSIQFNSISEKYSNDFISAIAANGDYERLYAELEKQPELIIERLGKIVYKQEIKNMISDKIIPYLRIYANSGTDGMLESLCALALCIENDLIEPVLNELFIRWCNRFDRSEKKLQHKTNIPLWRAFNSLRRHTRFKNISNYDIRLLEILKCNIYWIYRDNIINSIKDSRRCYIEIEQLLMKAAPFEHSGWDEVDRLDEIAQRLFKEII